MDNHPQYNKSGLPFVRKQTFSDYLQAIREESVRPGSELVGLGQNALLGDFIRRKEVEGDNLIFTGAQILYGALAYESRRILKHPYLPSPIEEHLRNDIRISEGIHYTVSGLPIVSRKILHEMDFATPNDIELAIKRREEENPELTQSITTLLCNDDVAREEAIKLSHGAGMVYSALENQMTRNLYELVSQHSH